MTIILTPEVEAAIAEQARQWETTPEQLVADSLRYLFVSPEPSEEEEAYYKVQAQLLLDQIGRMMDEMAQEDTDREAERREWEARRAERAAVDEATDAILQRLLNEMELNHREFGSRPSKEEYAEKEAAERELEALRREHRRLCAEAGREPGWLFPELRTWT